MRASLPLSLTLTALLAGCSTDDFASADAGPDAASVDAPGLDAPGPDAGGDAAAPGCVRTAAFGTPELVVWRQSVNSPPSVFTGIVRFDRDEKRAVFDDGSASGIYFATADLTNGGFVGKTPYVAQPQAGSSFHPVLDGSGERLFFAYQKPSDNFLIMTGPADGSATPVTSAAIALVDLKMPYPLVDAAALYSATGADGASIYRFALDGSGKATAPVVAPGSDKFAAPATSVVVSGDELELYYGTGNTLQTAQVYHSTRANLGAEWSIPKLVTFPSDAVGETPTYLSGDGCRLYYRGYAKSAQRALFVVKKPAK